MRAAVSPLPTPRPSAGIASDFSCTFIRKHNVTTQEQDDSWPTCTAVPDQQCEAHRTTTCTQENSLLQFISRFLNNSQATGIMQRRNVRLMIHAS